MLGRQCAVHTLLSVVGAAMVLALDNTVVGTSFHIYINILLVQSYSCIDTDNSALLYNVR